MAKKNMDEALVNAYIGTGDKVDKLKDGSFSWCAFFFGALYFMYRKMIGLGIVILLLNAIIASFGMPILVALLIDVIEGILFGILFKKIYVMHAEKQVEKIKSNNSTKTDEEIVALCAKQGNPSVGMVVLGLFLSGIFSSFVAIINPNSTFNKAMGIINGANKEMQKLQESYDVAGNIEFGVPEGFEETEFSAEMMPTYEYERDNSNCVLTVNTFVQNDGETVKSFIDEISLEPGESMGDITTQTVNGVEWSKVRVTGQPIYGTAPTYDYYYVTAKNDKIYEVQYSIYRDEAGVCASVQEDIVNSLKIKR